MCGINWRLSKTAGLLSSDPVLVASSGQNLSAEKQEDQVMGPQGDMLKNDTGGLLSDIQGDLLYILQHEVRCDLLRHIYVQIMDTYR